MKDKEDIYKLTSIVLILDQIVKLIVSKNMEFYQKITIIPNFFSLFHVKNTGAAFSILEDNTWFIILISVVFILALNHYIKKESHHTSLEKVSLGLLLGGIFGNLIDRIIHHAVIDYLSFTFGKYEFPVFNIADIAITVGIGLFILDMFKKERKNKNESLQSHE